MSRVANMKNPASDRNGPLDGRDLFPADMIGNILRLGLDIPSVAFSSGGEQSSDAGSQGQLQIVTLPRETE